MPSRHERKKYIAGGIYHIFNRGVNKTRIFFNNNDYRYFEECMMLYLIPENQLLEYLMEQNYSHGKILSLLLRAKDLKNYAGSIELIAYCLMPNHFHLLVKQYPERGISQFIKSLQTRYVMYISRKYHRIGPLYQSRYKAIPVENEQYFNIVKNYIHMNPQELIGFSEQPEKYPWSSYRDYIDGTSRKWVKARY